MWHGRQQRRCRAWLLLWCAAAALTSSAAAGGLSAAAKKKKKEEALVVTRSKNRAWRSSMKQMFHPIPESWGGGITCEDPLPSDDFVVAVATDARDALPIFAVINSTVSNAVTLKRISFVVLVTHETRASLLELVRRFIPKKTRTGQFVHVSVCVGLDEQLTRRPAMMALAQLRNSTRVKRKELLSSFNFAAFYLPHILAAKRVLYLDSDVVVRGDVGELAHLHLRGRAAAAVEDCTQRLTRYVDFPLAETYRQAASRRVAAQAGDCAAAVADAAAESAPPPHCEPAPRALPPNNTCVFNRGVLLLNRHVWLKERVAERIERLVVDFVHSRGVLFRAGVSQPPFLLALAARYFKLGAEWNVRGLGRDAVGHPEWAIIASHARKNYLGFAGAEAGLSAHMRRVAQIRHARALAQLRAQHRLGPHGKQGRHAGDASPYGDHLPYVCPFAAHAKILHFNGEVKPWRMSRATVDDAEPGEGALCLWLDVQPVDTNATRTTRSDAFCKSERIGDCVNSCARDWLRYVDSIPLDWFHTSGHVGPEVFRVQAAS
mmetsp:Transcript_4674/g.16693  ORF Transcript_4674/g.16693 Transcript_4674/m.16693 type:complete len:547 (+) Transcript_4674:109-1749(+)